MPPRASAQPRPAATLALLREAAAGFEMLLLRRNRKLSFHGGAWVFPGGRIDPGDYEPDRDLERAARRAALRELREEAGLVVPAESLVPFARWTTPEVLPKRFDTWFFMAAGASGEVSVDGGEILEHRWIRPETALMLRRDGELELPPPTFVTTLRLAACASAFEALARARQGEVEVFLPRIQQVPGGVCSLYQDDVAYDGGDIERDGRRHRLWMIETDWRYERSP